MEKIKVLHIISRSLHFIAAGTLIGSMIHNLFAVIPGLKHLGMPRSNATNMIVTKHFLTLMWISLVVLVITGTYATTDVHVHNKLFPILQQPAGITLLIKLLLVAIIAVIMLLQAYTIMPKMKKLLNPATPKNQENDLAMVRTSKSVVWVLIAHVSVGIVVVVLSVTIFQLVK